MAVETLYGRHAVHEALRAGRRRFYSLILAANVREAGLVQEIVALVGQAGCPVQRAERGQLERRLPGVNHQGVVLEASPYPHASLEAILALARAKEEAPLLLLLDQLEDPQNLGTLLRTAEVMGVHGVILPKHRAASITPAVCNSSSGAVEHLLVAVVTNLARTQEALKGQGVWVAGLDSRPEARDLAQADLSGSLALVVGSEGRGLSRLVRERCDWLVRIPMVGQVESLNAAVAGSVVLVAARMARQNDHQRR